MPSQRIPSLKSPKRKAPGEGSHHPLLSNPTVGPPPIRKSRRKRTLKTWFPGQATSDPSILWPALGSSCMPHQLQAGRGLSRVTTGSLWGDSIRLVIARDIYPRPAPPLGLFQKTCWLGVVSPRCPAQKFLFDRLNFDVRIGNLFFLLFGSLSGNFCFVTELQGWQFY